MVERENADRSTVAHARARITEQAFNCNRYCCRAAARTLDLVVCA